MNKTQMKEKRSQLIYQYEESCPGFQERKKLIFKLMSVVVASRALHAALQILFCAVRNIPLNPSDITQMMMMVFVAFYFFVLIYSSGLKSMAALALFGGFYSLYSAYSEGIFANLAKSDRFFSMVNIVFLAVIFLQILIMGFFVLDKKCGLYFSTMTQIQKDMSAWAKNKD